MEHRSATPLDSIPAVDANVDFVSQDASSDIRSTLKISHANFKVKPWRKAERTILDDVSFSVKSGELLALMGPSGAGKTTLMEFMTLSLKGGVLDGDLQLDERPLTSDVFKRSVSYVPQFDIHWAFLTCREVLEYAGMLFITGGAKECLAQVEHVLESMGLQECAGTRCGNEFLKGLSGGQKKRLALAVALLKDPSALLLDEPTSGLDAAAASSVMGYLRTLSQKESKIIVATIHQPSTPLFLSCSRVIFLANGRMAYHGEPGEVEEFCEAVGEPLPLHTNPADHFMQLINSEFAGRDSVDRIVAAWRSKEAIPEQAEWPLSKPSAAAVSRRSPGLLAQCGVLLRRHGLLSLRDPTLYSGRAVALLLSNSFFAVVYLKARPRSQEYVLARFYLTVWMFGVATLFAAIVVFTANVEFKMLQREMKNGMVSASSYLVASTLLPLPYMLLLSVFALLVPFYLIGNGNVDGMWQSVLVLAATLWSFESSAQTLAVMVGNPLIGASVSISLWITSFLFMGQFLKPEFIIWPFRVFNWLFPLTWTMRSMQYLELHDTVWQGAHRASDGELVCPGVAAITCYGHTGDDVLTSLSHNFPVSSGENVALDVLYILGYGVFWKALQFSIVPLKRL